MNTPILANIVDIRQKRIYPAYIHMQDGKISRLEAATETPELYALPGFVDAHVHIESSMLVPSEFARLAVVHGTVATVSDPHEIANVLGVPGVEYMIQNGALVPFKFYFGAPSCVPATPFETAGAEIGVEGIERLLQLPEVLYLAEMMNYPAVLNNDPSVMAKIVLAKKYNKPIDGHAPALRGEDARFYAAAGISTDHECFTYDEALEKIQYGMKILIREGSAAKNFEALIPLLSQYPKQIMFCSDDKHPDDLIKGHINQLVVRALKKGNDLFDVLQAACINPVEHYKLDVGILQIGDPADFILVDDLKAFQVVATYINGQKLAANGRTTIERSPIDLMNHFDCTSKKAADFKVAFNGEQRIQVIKALDGEIVTEKVLAKPAVDQGYIQIDPARDILKLSVVNRYREAPPAVAFIQGFGIQDGALASCVGHDSHNIIAVGTNDELIAKAVNSIIEHKGGISAVSPTEAHVLPLPIAGIMSDNDGFQVAADYAAIDAFAKNVLGSTLGAPFMTLSFMALLVIPELKLSDLGLFDCKTFQICTLAEGTSKQGRT